MIRKIDHIGVAVNNLEEALKLYTDFLGFKASEVERDYSEKDKVKTAMIRVGESKIELLESTDPEGPVAKFISKRGEGIHHLSFGVSGIDGMLKTLKEKGVPLIDNEARAGVGGTRAAFLHPKGTKVLMELVEH